jgi:hypothetical protein
MPHPNEITMTLDRGLQVLRAFHAERQPLTNGELVARTGLSRSVVSRLTSTLIQLGFIGASPAAPASNSRRQSSASATRIWQPTLSRGWPSRGCSNWPTS